LSKSSSAWLPDSDAELDAELDSDPDSAPDSWLVSTELDSSELVVSVSLSLSLLLSSFPTRTDTVTGLVDISFFILKNKTYAMGAAHTKAGGGAPRNLSLVAEKIGPFDKDAVARTAAVVPFLQFRDTPEGVALQSLRADHETRDVLDDILAAASGACFQLHLPGRSQSDGAILLCHDPAQGWRLHSMLTSQAVQAAHLVLAGVAPTPAICAQLPWCSVPGFVDTHAQLVGSTSTHTVPTVLVPHMLHTVLHHGGTVDLAQHKGPQPDTGDSLPGPDTGPACNMGCA